MFVCEGQERPGGSSTEQEFEHMLAFVDECNLFGCARGTPEVAAEIKNLFCLYFTIKDEHELLLQQTKLRIAEKDKEIKYLKDELMSGDSDLATTTGGSLNLQPLQSKDDRGSRRASFIASEDKRHALAIFRLEDELEFQKSETRRAKLVTEDVRRALTSEIDMREIHIKQISEAYRETLVSLDDCHKELTQAKIDCSNLRIRLGDRVDYHIELEVKNFRLQEQLNSMMK